MRLRPVQRSVQRAAPRTPLHGLFGPTLAPEGAILHFDADVDAFSEQTGGPHTFNHAVLSPQYQRNADGSYANVGAKPAVDTFDGERWVRSCGAVTNLIPAGWPFSSTSIAVSTLNDYVKLEKTTAIGSAMVPSGSLPAGVLYTATITLRAGSGLTGTKFDFGYYYNGFKPIAVSSFSGPGTYVVTGDPVVKISNLSPTEDTTVSFTLTSILETNITAFFYPCGIASAELGASVLIKDFIITATSYPVPYVPPGVTQPASNATTTNGVWFALPDGSPLWQALDGQADGVELVTNGGFDSATGWTLESGWAVVNGVLVSSGGVNANAIITTPTPFVTGAMYRVLVDITSYSSGELRIGLGGFVYGTAGKNAQSFSVILKASGSTDKIYVNNNAGIFVGSIDNISIQRIQPQPLTLATRVRMGVGSGDFSVYQALQILSSKAASAGVQYAGASSVAQFVARAYDGVAAANMEQPWPRNSIIRRVTQVNTSGTQFRVGYMIEGTHTAIQWSPWGAFGGSFNPSTLYRLMLGYNNPHPMWFNKITAWGKQCTDAEILEAMA